MEDGQTDYYEKIKSPLRESFMSQNSNKESGWFLGRSALLGVSVAVALCFTLISLYSMGLLPLELVLVASVVPFLLWLFSERQEIMLLTVIETDATLFLIEEASGKLKYRLWYEFICD